MNKNWIYLGIVGALLFCGLMSAYSTYNTVIGLEEQINTSKSGIRVQEKRRIDLITKLVQTVEANAKFEASTQIAVAKVRSEAQSGNVAQASIAIHAVAEATPSLGANAAFTQLMKELAVTENSIAEYRDTYNKSVLDYKRFTRRLPASATLPFLGYRISDFKYLDFDNTEMPADLFPTSN